MTTRLSAALGALVATASLTTACGGGSEAAQEPSATVTVTAEPDPEPTDPSPSAALPTQTGPSQFSDEELIANLSSAVVRVATTTCDGLGSGTGFQVAPNLVVTAAHVVEGAASVSVTNDSELASAEVLGLDPGTDTALLRTSTEVSDRVLPLVGEDVAQGSRITALGFPLGVWQLRNTSGNITSGRTVVEYADQRVDPVVMTDADINGGYSGGPALTSTGEVAGLVSGSRNFDEAGNQVDGEKFLVPASSISAGVARWRDAAALTAAQCGEVDAPDEDYSLDIVMVTDDPVALSATQTLFNHGQSINVGDYEAAHALFTPAAAARFPMPTWGEGLASSYWERLEVLQADTLGPGKIRLRALLTTAQDASVRDDGATCTRYGMDYTLVAEDADWLIDSVETYRPIETC